MASERVFVLSSVDDSQGRLNQLLEDGWKLPYQFEVATVPDNQSLVLVLTRQAKSEEVAK